MIRRTISTDRAPAPVGHYSQARQLGSVVAVSGQVGIDPTDGRIVEGVMGQVDQTMTNLEVLLHEAGCSMNDVVRMDCYLTSYAHFTAFNAAYARWFDGEPPARTTVVVELAPGIDVEITALAVVPQ